MEAWFPPSHDVPPIQHRPATAQKAASVADGGLEDALDLAERDIDATLKGLAAAMREAKKAKAAAASGQLRDLVQALGAASRLADQAAAAAEEAREGWRFDDEIYFADGSFAVEVLTQATAAGVQAFESDDRILCYPAIVQVSAADATVIIDKKKDRRVRPSVLVRTLAALQAKPPKFKPDAFLESLATAYDHVIARSGGRIGATAKLVDIYGVLTVLPGATKEYTKQEFARDLYLLDQSGKTNTKDGRMMQLPASALTRGSAVLATVTRSGQEKVYAGITFASEAR